MNAAWQANDLPWGVRSGAALLALVLHVALVLMLLLHLREQDAGVPAVQAELWSPQALHQADQPHVVPPVPVPPVPVPQQQEVTQPKPDIALAEEKRQQQAKADQQRAQLQQALLEQAQKLKQQQEQKLKQAQAEQLKKQQEIEKQQQLVQQQQAAEAIKEQRQKALKALLAKQTQAGIQAESVTALNGARKQVMAAHAGVNDKLRNEYIARIQSKIRGMLIIPPGLQGNPQVVYHVSLLPTGDVLTVKLVRSSGQPAYDEAAQRAIYKASPLPMPPDAGLAQQFRELDLPFTPANGN